MFLLTMRRNPKWWIMRLPTNPTTAAGRALPSRSALNHDQAMLFSIIPTITHNIPATNRSVLLETPGLYLSFASLLKIGFIRIKMVGQYRKASLRETHPTFTFSLLTFRYVFQQTAVLDYFESKVRQRIKANLRTGCFVLYHAGFEIDIKLIAVVDFVRGVR